MDVAHGWLHIATRSKPLFLASAVRSLYPTASIAEFIRISASVLQEPVAIDNAIIDRLEAAETSLAIKTA